MKSESCGKCHYCETSVFPAGSDAVWNDEFCKSTRDHYTPRSITAGSDLDEGRIVQACSRCNRLKGDTAPEIFEYFVRQTNMAQPIAALQKEYRRFCYLLAVAGFRSAKALAFVKAKKSIPKSSEPIDLPWFLPLRDMQFLEAAE